MKHEEIEAYIKSRDLDVMQYQLAIDAMYYAEQAIIEKACAWLEEQNEKCMFEIEMILGKYFIEDFKKKMEE